MLIPVLIFYIEKGGYSKEYAITALGKLNTRLDLIKEALSDENPYIREAAMNALKEINTPETNAIIKK